MTYVNVRTRETKATQHLHPHNVYPSLVSTDTRAVNKTQLVKQNSGHQQQFSHLFKQLYLGYPRSTLKSRIRPAWRSRYFFQEIPLVCVRRSSGERQKDRRLSPKESFYLLHSDAGTESEKKPKSLEKPSCTKGPSWGEAQHELAHSIAEPRSVHSSRFIIP